MRTQFSRRHHRRNSKNLFFIYSQSVDKHNTQQSYIYTHCYYAGGDGGNSGSVGAGRRVGNEYTYMFSSAAAATATAA